MFFYFFNFFLIFYYISSLNYFFLNKNNLYKYFFILFYNFYKYNFYKIINICSHHLFFFNFKFISKFKKLFFYKLKFKKYLLFDKNSFIYFLKNKKIKKFDFNFFFIFKVFFIFFKNIYKNKLYCFNFLNFNFLNFNFLNFNFLNFNFLNFNFLNFYKINFFLSKFFDKYKLYKYIFKSFFDYNKYNNFFVLLNNNYFLLNNNYFDNFKINFIILNKINLLYNNQYPIFFINIFKNNFFLKFDLKKKYNFLNLINLFFINFFEYFFKKSFFLKISNNKKLINLNKMLLVFEKYNKNFFKINKSIFLNEMVEIIWISFYNKDLIFLKNWLIKILNSLNLINHKKFFNIFHDVITENFELLSNNLNINGFFFCVKGKIGLSGNAKKKKFFFKQGKLKVSSKNSKIEIQKIDVKTNCGSLGINIILSY